MRAGLSVINNLNFESLALQKFSQRVGQPLLVLNDQNFQDGPTFRETIIQWDAEVKLKFRQGVGKGDWSRKGIDRAEEDVLQYKKRPESRPVNGR